MDSPDELSDDDRTAVAELMARERTRVRSLALTMSNPTLAITIVKSVYRQIDSLVEHVIRNRPPDYFDCRAGCSYCCTLRVSAFPVEIFGIAREIAKFDEPRRVALKQRLEAHAQLAHGVEVDDFFLVCPLLEDHKCSVYDVRPESCRVHMSLDVEACKDETAPSIPKDSELTLKGAALMMGAKEGFSVRRQVSASAELGQCVRAAVADPALEKKWFKGADVFAAFRGPDD